MYVKTGIVPFVSRAMKKLAELGLAETNGKAGRHSIWNLTPAGQKALADGNELPSRPKAGTGAKAVKAVRHASGQRVLLLEEAEDYWRWTMSGVGRSRGRRKKETESTASPEPTTSTLWASPDGPEARHTCMCETRHPAQENDRGWPRTDRSPLAAAVADALDAYDVIVLLPRYWSWRPHGPARLPPPALSHCCIGVVLAARQGRYRLMPPRRMAVVRPARPCR
ncbi:hypothetical protein ACWD4L_13940 [Streptomyces sp. NPDC002596]